MERNYLDHGGWTLERSGIKKVRVLRGIEPWYPLARQQFNRSVIPAHNNI
jgi:hypothetical protein